MQIRYLEAMQAMAKSSNSKVIFMPGPVNSGDFGLPTGTIEAGEAGPSTHGDDQVQHAVNAHVLEHM
jgi:erythrocyte band 7 integral membrane protein